MHLGEVDSGIQSGVELSGGGVVPMRGEQVGGGPGDVGVDQPGPSSDVVTAGQLGAEHRLGTGSSGLVEGGGGALGPAGGEQRPGHREVQVGCRVGIGRPGQGQRRLGRLDGGLLVPPVGLAGGELGVQGKQRGGIRVAGPVQLVPLRTQQVGTVAGGSPQPGAGGLLGDRLRA